VGPQVHNNLSAEATITHCDIDQPGFEASNGNIRLDPLFGDPLQEDFRLLAGSPCIDAGTTDGIALPEVDFDGNLRIIGSSVDIGAYEYNE
jgi:hypothetical protein